MDIEPNELGDQFTVLNLNDIQQQFFEQDDEDIYYREYREDRYEEYREDRYEEDREDDYYRNQEEDREEFYGNQDDDREEPEDISAAEDQEDQEDQYQEGEQEAQHYSNSGWYNVQTRMFHIGEMDGTQFVPYMEDVRNIEYFGQNVEEAEIDDDSDTRASNLLQYDF